MNVKASMDRMIIFLLAAVYIAQQLTHWGPLNGVLGGLVFVAMLMLLPKLKGAALWLSVLFLAGGVTLMLVQRADLNYWLEAASINVTLVTLFVFAPLFGIPVRIPAYVEALKRFYARRVSSGTVLYIGTQILTQIMGAFINVGSIPVVYHLAFVRSYSPRMSGLLASAMNRGFGGAIFWSPYFAAMALVTSALAVSWSSLLPYLIGLSLLSLLASIAVDWKGLGQKANVPEEKRVPAAADSDSAMHRQSGVRAEKRESAAFPLSLGLYLILAIAIILLMEELAELPMVLITCMTAVIFPVVWCLSKGSMPSYWQGLRNHVTVTLPALQKEITLFLAAGFFSGSIAATGFGAYIPGLLEHIPLPVVLSFSVMTVLAITLSSLIGLHPIVPVTVLATGIDPAVVHISPVYFAVLLLGSWGISNPISPASAVNNLLAGLLNRSVFELAKPNYKFTAVMAIALLLYLALVFA